MMLNKILPPESESEIISQWVYDDKVYISCICIVFNQFKYVRHAIDSILAQKTEYRFEVLIHDDCSSDGTTEILLDYKRRYPRLVNLVLQEENQYSKGKKITPLIVPYAKGEYVAFCEGDDYWCKDNKLQVQINALEKNKEVDLCVHDSFCLNCRGLESNYRFPLGNYSEGIIPFSAFSDVYTQFSPTASMFCRLEALQAAAMKISNAPCGDIFLEIYLGAGRGYYNVDGKFSVYNLGSSGSWAERNKSSVKRSIELKEKVIAHLLKVKEELNPEDKMVVYKKILKIEKSLLIFKSQSHFLEAIRVIPLWCKNIYKSKTLGKEDVKIAAGLLGFRSKYFSDKG
ncbi:glycosyltransferase family 2 protein [Pseudoalteromonas sp. McH1-7]|uniref:glycosyltransferase n=1 Tax=Pseudoalteromonas sp. McH1-7 TaxID=2745574 RepID=UPI001590C476|nr:glycosyltransferase family 2 protein [Pseudoalteromonas sp. McH1-7]NUZ10661.1 glycosyltransferase family 2 protein [Pseudoalteromonas sp. McH1-7]